MPDRTPKSPPPHNSPDAPPPTPLGRQADRPIRHASITAGAGILLIAVLAGFGKFVAVDGLVTPGDAPRTATDILASEGLFRLGVAALSVVVALDVVVAWALCRVPDVRADMTQDRIDRPDSASATRRRRWT